VPKADPKAGSLKADLTANAGIVKKADPKSKAGSVKTKVVIVVGTAPPRIMAERNELVQK
jgi:hypothetical protein